MGEMLLQLPLAAVSIVASSFEKRMQALPGHREPVADWLNEMLY